MRSLTSHHSTCKVTVHTVLYYFNVLYCNIMKNNPVTYKDVEATIAVLKADGIKVTNDAILAKLGRGSKGTIHKHFRAWQETQPKPRAEERKLPDSIFKAIVREIDEVETKAVAHLQAELAEIQHNADELASAGEELEGRVNELEDELSKEREEKTKLLTVLEMKDTNIEKLEAEKTTLQKTIDRLNTDLAKSELKLEDYSELKSEFKKLQEELRNALIEAAELRGKNQPISSK